MSSNATLDDFFSTALDYYLIPDLKRLRTCVRPIGDQQGCTIATALFAFSLIDLLGFLIRPEESPAKTDTRGNIDRLLCKQTELFPEQYWNATPALVKLFRHGITHQVFPKACGISKPTPSIQELIFTGSDGTPNLNVDVLVDDLLDALKSLRERVNKDPSLASRMDRRLVFLQQEDYFLLQEMKQKDRILGSPCPPGSGTTATTTTSQPYSEGSGGTP